ncbi:P-loop containing nucleoside triphosphate hydrolase protein [Schizophyllum amplum]|uniref:RNA helicase n=1 Tax=Schizophyllum amplum TaxID=97359 RepID=A0A550CAT9_9AGAR|nr:P-loop containing nucleoside triphosphate hydrolase protein [Auriculariopsis ampla]
MASKLEPLSIESLLQKQRAEKEAAAKPKFLSKEERAKLAIAKRAAEIREGKDKEERARKEREELERRAEEVRRATGSGRFDDRYSSRPDDRDRDRDRDRSRRDRGGYRGGRDRDRDRDRDQRDRDARERDARDRDTRERRPDNSFDNVPTADGASPSQADNDLNASYTPQLTTSDLSAIRSRYLGVDRKKRKIRKMNDRKFVFDWDAQDDTAAGVAPPAAAGQAGGALMFGRGRVAGMDGAGREDHHADPMERRRAAKSGTDERHWSEKALDEMKERDWRIFREDFSIAARGGQIPHPLRSWAESDIPATILEVIETVGYKEPSPIQRQAIPIGLQNRDIIGIAETGSGKTAAFVIPLLAFISVLAPLTDENRHLGPFALILAPTRELAQQIESEARKFASGLGFTCVSIVGGRAVEEQQFNLREGAEIIIATPGRLKDVLERHVIVLSQCRYVVMDEADRMVHLGFEPDLNFILDQLPAETMVGEEAGDMMVVDDSRKRHDDHMMMIDGEQRMKLVKKGRTRVTTLFSATMPPAVERLARKYLRRPAIITIGEAGRAVDTVEQRVEFVNGDEKKKHRLLEILNSGQYASPIIVFVNQKKMADMVAKDLSRAGWSASTLHSGKNQEQREAALAALRSGEADILVATDLAGRGIDVQDVSLVVNFQMANTIEAYVHRIGRTGRAGKMGISITFLTNEDDEVMYDLKQEISKSPVSKVSVELAKHESAQHKVTRDMKRKRDPDDIG